jgi:hydroxymethylbilane synthase
MNAAPSPLRFATRGSQLALIQTALAIKALTSAGVASGLAGGRTVESTTIEIDTEGDRDRATPLAVLGGRGVFVKAIEDALLDGAADVAVHSLKDVPAALPEGLTLAAFLPREDPRDALVASGGRRLAELPAGARVGTSSRRRAALLRALRPDIEAADIRGNVNTRLGKVAAGEYDGALLAAAGLRRLGRFDEVTQLFEEMEFPPAPGQGTIALQCRADDDATLELLATVDDADARGAAEAERGFLAALGTGCSLPVGAFARLSDGLLAIRGMIASEDPEDSSPPAFGDATGPAEDAAALGRSLAERLLEGEPSFAPSPEATS